MRLDALVEEALETELSHATSVTVGKKAKDLCPVLILQVLVAKSRNEVLVLHNFLDFSQSCLQNFILVLEWELRFDLLKSRVVFLDLLDNLLSILILKDVIVPHFGCLIEVLTDLPDLLTLVEFGKELLFFRNRGRTELHSPLIRAELLESLRRIIELLLDPLRLLEGFLRFGVFLEQDLTGNDALNQVLDLLLLVSDSRLELLDVYLPSFIHL
jgi:hypothetical protein